MGILQGAGKFFPAGLNVVAKPCDYCKSAAALLFCRVDSAFMCIPCDAKVHRSSSAAGGLKHERVWMCEVCEQAPAVVTCKADAAALCVTCDRDIHAANPLASRHERVQVVPFYDTAESVMMKSTAAAALLLPPVGDCNHSSIFAAAAPPPPPPPPHMEQQNAYIPDSWISMNPIITAAKLIPAENPDLKSMELLFQDSDQFLDFDNYQISSQPFTDSVVPIQTATIEPPVPARLGHEHSPEDRFDIDFAGSNINSYNSYTTHSLSHSVSSSSMDVGVVPEGNSMSEISYSLGRTINSSGDGSQVVGMDREARVLRYKEKRKNRKFEKTIRYASRKAYAETRPRIKGRFAKRTESESDLDRIFGAGAANFIADARYGIVPSF
ncbi:hypothetical protein ABFS82_10G133400 [Erythranthe guttata]|uniref:LOW QUALITY PROTEIN: zinc finger protein CONSTANS-LIKE 5 n=1 Tax=Erythranthe guttata TaxID=4155 RepID=UPI00064DB812|nr:PREDICTED: LOW QUALITY PROTEIN: zinc finger protein CONSTANS-LIKE 5 [Erythranthe guttata]|eukprot:XP_012831316.1 PREDICTED: LOW QUALITY PROTEIN: zinc finger protein CONSTANS-LIKE 5 [Erythranthe guttata]